MTVLRELALEQQIKDRRRELRMTQTDLSHKSGVGYATISRIENNRGPRPNRATLIALAYALQVDPEDLLAHLSEDNGGE